MVVKQWHEDAVWKLQGSLECTDWSVFVHANLDLNDLVDTVSWYIQFCSDNAIPSKEV